MKYRANITVQLFIEDDGKMYYPKADLAADQIAQELEPLFGTNIDFIEVVEVEPEV